ncbi:MAG: protein jag [Nocardioidaceae bacterium]
MSESPVSIKAGDIDESTEPTRPVDSAAPADGSELDSAKSGAADFDDSGQEGEVNHVQRLEAEGDIAADYLEELLDLADLDGDIDMDVEADRAAVSIVGPRLNSLVGEDGEVLEALQELTRLAVYRQTGQRSRLMLDIGGFRADLRKNLVQLAEEAIEDVKESGQAVKLTPMTAFERKVIHDAVAAAGLASESDGVEPTRCVVVLPAP